MEEKGLSGSTLSFQHVLKKLQIQTVLSRAISRHHLYQCHSDDL